MNSFQNVIIWFIILEQATIKKPPVNSVTISFKEQIVPAIKNPAKEEKTTEVVNLSFESSKNKFNCDFIRTMGYNLKASFILFVYSFVSSHLK